MTTMPARICGTCSIAFPYTIGPCPVCGGRTTYVGHKLADENWRAKADELLEASAPPPPIPHLPVHPVRDGNGREWLYAEHVRPYWRANVDVFTLFELPDARVVEVVGYDKSNRRWWIEQVAISDGGA